MDTVTEADGTQQVDWRYASPATFQSPLRWRGPYVECKLEHPQLEATCLRDRFFPDSVPYQDGESRLFCWRRQLCPPFPPAETWTGLCGTTHGLAPLTHDAVGEPTLHQSCADGAELVVDGTVVGESTTALVSGYSGPAIQIRHVTPDCVELTVEGTDTLVPAGTSERTVLARQTVETMGGTSVRVTPEFVVRFHGMRTVFHPAPTAEYTLFPSFGLDIDGLARRITVPTDRGTLHHDKLATEFGIDVQSLAYPERILWRAFASSAFDPQSPGTAELTQFDDGTIAGRKER